MKRILFIAAIVTVCCAVSCNNGGEDGTNGDAVHETVNETVNGALKGTIMISLLEHGLPIWVIVPDTLAAHLDITVRDWGEIEIRSGNNFQMAVADGGDLELKKSDINSDLLFSDPKILIEDEEGIVYSQGVKNDEYFKPINHFYAVKNINGVNYEFKDIEGEYKYPEKVVMRMFEAAKATTLDDRKPKS
jgi:hypothetical protein